MFYFVFWSSFHSNQNFRYSCNFKLHWEQRDIFPRNTEFLRLYVGPEQCLTNYYPVYLLNISLQLCTPKQTQNCSVEFHFFTPTIHSDLIESAAHLSWWKKFPVKNSHVRAGNKSYIVLIQASCAHCVSGRAANLPVTSQVNHKKDFETIIYGRKTALRCLRVLKTL